MTNIYDGTGLVEELSPEINERIEKLSEISDATGFDWFDITDYKNTAQFTPDDWYQALNLRAHMKEAVTKIKAGAFDFDSGFDLIFYGTLADPLGVSEADPLEVSGSTLIPHKSVRVAEYEDVCVDEWSFGCKDLLFPGDPSIAPSISKIKDEQDWDSRAQEGRNKQSVVLVADLSMSENKLLTEFRALIRAHKTSIKDQPKKMGVSDRDIEKYTEHQVLGYWDLTLFARLKGISLKNEEKADKLFPLASQSPNNIKGKDNIRLTIMPFAEKAISEEHLTILRGQL